LLRSLWAITKNSFIEITRQPIYGILLLVGVALIAFSPIITMFTLMEDVKLTIDMGLGTIFMVGIALAILSATQVISREIEAKTAGAIMSKPVGRFVFVAGKFLGVTLAMMLACYLFILFLVMTVRMGVPSEVRYKLDLPVFLAELGPFLLAVGLGIYANYFYRWNFTSTAVTLSVPLYTLGFLGLCLVDKEWGFDWFAGSFIACQGHQVARAGALVSFGVWIMSSVAVAASTRVNVVANVLICACVFFVGMVSQYLFGWTVAEPAWSWEPVPGAGTVEISGQVRDAQAQPVQGVVMRGAPRAPATDESGAYRLAVKAKGSGKITPYRLGYVFSPPSRLYGNLTSDQSDQGYTAFQYQAGVLRYASGTWTSLAWIAYHVVPSFQLFWVADQLLRPEPFIPLGYVARAALYATTWCAAMVALGSFLFESRELI